MKGVVQESSTSQKYKSSKGLDLEDILNTANVAKMYTNLDKQVWLDYSNCKGWKHSHTKKFCMNSKWWNLKKAKIEHFYLFK